MHKKKIIYTTGPYMRRFFFSIANAVDLVNFAIKNSNKFKGKIICSNMKSALILDVLKIWIKNYGGKYKIIENRKGDRIDEFLIGDNEIKNTYEIKSKNKIYYIIDYEKNFKNHIQSIISSANAKKLSEKEIVKLIRIGMK